MYYILVSDALCRRRGVFLERRLLKDGNRILTERDLSLTKFSYGDVKVLNDKDLSAYIQDLESDNGVTNAENTEDNGTDNQ